LGMRYKPQTKKKLRWLQVGLPPKTSLFHHRLRRIWLKGEWEKVTLEQTGSGTRRKNPNKPHQFFVNSHGSGNLTEKLLANAKLVKDLRITVDDGRAHSVCLDLPPELGTDMGPTALELGVMSYAGCFVTIFALTAKKMRISLKELEVKLEAVKSEDVGTITEANFDVTVNADAPEDRIQRIFKLTVENCPVGKLFEEGGVKTKYGVKIVKE
jgi:uncharacterized OsmC-like protein